MYVSNAASFCRGLNHTQWAKSPKKKSEGVCFVNSTLKMLCHVVKNTLLQSAFSAIERKSLDKIINRFELVLSSFN